MVMQSSSKSIEFANTRAIVSIEYVFNFTVGEQRSVNSMAFAHKY